jgi:hypothetical protein
MPKTTQKRPSKTADTEAPKTPLPTTQKTTPKMPLPTAPEPPPEKRPSSAPKNTPSAPTPPVLIDSSDLAALLNLSLTHISRLAAKGVLFRVTRGKYHFAESVLNYFDYRDEDEEKRTGEMNTSWTGYHWTQDIEQLRRDRAPLTVSAMLAGFHEGRLTGRFRRQQGRWPTEAEEGEITASAFRFVGSHTPDGYREPAAGTWFDSQPESIRAELDAAFETLPSFMGEC